MSDKVLITDGVSYLPPSRIEYFYGRVERDGSDYTANEPDEVLVTMLSIADPSTKLP